MATNGELHDANGYPIHKGDLLRQFHFVGPRRKRFYLYHVAVERDGHLYGVPTQYLEPTMAKGGGTFLIKEEDAEFLTILSGYGPGDCLDHTDRPRKRKEPVDGNTETR